MENSKLFRKTISFLFTAACSYITPVPSHYMWTVFQWQNPFVVQLYILMGKWNEQGYQLWRHKLRIHTQTLFSWVYRHLSIRSLPYWADHLTRGNFPAPTYILIPYTLQYSRTDQAHFTHSLRHMIDCLINWMLQ